MYASDRYTMDETRTLLHFLFCRVYCQTSNPLPLSLGTCTSLELITTHSVFRLTFVKTTRDPDTKFFFAIRTQFPKSMPVIRKLLLALVTPKPKKSSRSRLLHLRVRASLLVSVRGCYIVRRLLFKRQEGWSVSIFF